MMKTFLCIAEMTNKLSKKYLPVPTTKYLDTQVRKNLTSYLKKI